MGINDIIQNIKNVKWTWTDDFDFFFQNRKINIQDIPVQPGDLWDMCVMNIDIPQTSASNNSAIIAGKYRYYTSFYDTFTITVTFREIEKFSLRNYFHNIWIKQQTEYHDDIKSTLKIAAQGEIIFESDDVLINSVSQIIMDNSNTQILEFTVEFSTAIFSTNKIKNFGKKAL